MMASSMIYGESHCITRFQCFFYEPPRKLKPDFTMTISKFFFFSLSLPTIRKMFFVPFPAASDFCVLALPFASVSPGVEVHAVEPRESGLRMQPLGRKNPQRDQGVKGKA